MCGDGEVEVGCSSMVVGGVDMFCGGVLKS